MTSILDHQPPKIRSFPIKTEVKWALGIYIYTERPKGVQRNEGDAVFFFLGRVWAQS